MTEETLFHEALAKPAGERAAFLDKACAGQEDLRAAVEALLAAHEASAGLLDRPAEEKGQTGDYTPGPEEVVSPPDFRPGAGEGTLIAGRYTLVQKIGEGGMGEVWLAKQNEPVKRKVALKLIKAGFDSRAVVTRFEHERQALALMDHPNIARVLDGGLTPTGQPFFVMELVNGLGLAKFCDHARLSLRERLELFVPICQAVQHAHHKGIVHRDLKPANILVTLIDAMPVPKIIDFGVAKATGGKLTDESMATQFGAIVGTLEYLSPEQAGYSGQDIDTRADIYSLGVILYELLTGLRPIDAKRLNKAAFTEMIRIIQEEEPSKPSTRLSTDETLPSVAALRQTEPKKLMALLRGELDWVVMKCLEKQRERRYPTANGLAADIQRYLADEAVEARPPSAAYRLSKFLKRHKGPVIAASLLLLLLLGGIAGTTWGLIWADHARAAEAVRVTERDVALGKADVARIEVENTNMKLTTSQAELLKSNDQLLTSAARSLLRPLAVQFRPNQQAPPLIDQEIEPLWELAASKDERLRIRFVEVALPDRILTRRLKDRAGFALQAAVGLNEKLRTQVEEMFDKCLNSREILPEQQEEIALCLGNLGIHDPQRAGRTAALLNRAMSKTTDAHALQTLAKALAAVAARMEPNEAAGILTQAIGKIQAQDAPRTLAKALVAVAARTEPNEAIATLNQALAHTWEPVTRFQLMEGRSAVAAGLEPKAAAKIAAALTQALGKTMDGHLVKTLVEVAARMEPKEGASILLQAMGMTTEPIALGSLAEGLAAVAIHLEPMEAAQACGRAAGRLTQGIIKTMEESALHGLVQGLGAVVGRLNPREAAEAATTITEAMGKTTDQFALRWLAGGLGLVAPRLGPKEATAVAASLNHALSQTMNQRALQYLPEGLAAVLERMDPEEGARASRQAATTLIQLIDKTMDPGLLATLADGLSKVVALLGPKDSAQTCGRAATTLTQAMAKTVEGGPMQSLAFGLAQVADRLEPREAAEAAARLTQAMGKTHDFITMRFLAEGLGSIAPRLEQKEAAEAAARLTQTMVTMDKPTDWEALQTLAKGLAVLAGRMEPKEAAKLATTLTLALGKTTDQNTVRTLSDGLLALAARLEPKEASEVAARLIQAMNILDKPTDWVTLRSLAKALAAVAFRMEPKEAGVTLTQTMSKITEPGALQSLAEGLAAVTTHLEAKEADQARTRAAAILLQAMGRTTDALILHSLARGLSAVMIGLNPKEVAQAGGRGAAALSLGQRTDDYSEGMLAESLVTLATRMEPKEAAAILTRAMIKPTDDVALATLADGLLAMIARLEPKEAGAMLIQAMNKTTDPNILQQLARCLGALPVRLDSKEAVQACTQTAATLNQAMGKTVYSIRLGELAQGIAAVVAPMEAKEATQACIQAAAILTQAMGLAPDSSATQSLARGLSSVAARMEPKEAAATLTQAMARTTDANALEILSLGLSTVLFREPATTHRERYASATVTVAALGGPGLPFAALAWPKQVLDPMPPLLPPQTLVDVLKQPFCIDEARRLVLEQLTRHYHRPFADQWEFVEYVQKTKIDLDLTTPPECPLVGGEGAR